MQSKEPSQPALFLPISFSDRFALLFEKYSQVISKTLITSYPPKWVNRSSLGCLRSEQNHKLHMSLSTLPSSDIILLKFAPVNSGAVWVVSTFNLSRSVYNWQLRLSWQPFYRLCLERVQEECTTGNLSKTFWQILLVLCFWTPKFLSQWKISQKTKSMASFTH